MLEAAGNGLLMRRLEAGPGELGFGPGLKKKDFPDSSRKKKKKKRRRGTSPKDPQMVEEQQQALGMSWMTPAEVVSEECCVLNKQYNQDG